MGPYHRAMGQIRVELPYSCRFFRLQLHDGWATLEGEVEWPYQKERAEAAVRRVGDVKEVRNLVRVQPNVDPREVWRRIDDEFSRRRAAA
jgi:osmotically-inducible protein OsmY